ncbi:cytochrome P450, partial [Escherichia coli]
FLLSIHKEWQQKARNEVLRIFGHHNNPTSEGLSRLKTMTMIIHETLRLYPPAMTVSRQVVEKEVRLGSLLLPTTLQLT